MPASLVKIKVFLTVIISLIFSEGSALDITAADTLRMNRLLRKGQNFHHDRSDSAIFYYQKIYDQPEVKAEDFSLPVNDLEKGYLSTVIKALSLTGNIHYYNDEYKRAETYYRRSLDLAVAAGLETQAARALYDLGYVGYVTNDYEKANEYFEQSRQAYDDAGNRAGYLEALHARGKTFRRLGDLIMADSCYRECLLIAGELSDSVMISDIKINLGVLHCEQGRLEEGILLFEEALYHYEQIGLEQAVSTALLNIGVVLKMVQEYDKALDYIRRSTNIEESRQQKSQLAVRYYNMADLYLEMGRNDRAYEYCRKLQAVANEIGARPFAAECNFLLGKYYFLEKDYGKAGRYFNLASDSAARSNHKPLMANAWLWRAKSSLKQGNYSDAMDKALKSYSLSAEMNQVGLQKEAAMLISEIYEKRGNHREALKWHKVFLAHSDSLSHFDQQKEINRIEARYNYEKKEKENELLRNRASLQEQKLRNRNLLLIAFVSGILMSVIIILLLIKRSRDARLLYEQEQMLSIQHLREIESELDGKKRELASKMMFLNQKNDLISRIMERLKDIQQTSDFSPEELNDVVSELRMESPQSNWREFEVQFTQVHPGFYQKLFEKHPELTAYEQRVCAFLRMNLNTKEIAAITGRSAKSIEVTRSRIRTKLRLSRNDNLSSFLAAI